MGSFKTLAFVVLFCALLSPKNIFAEVHNHNGHHQKEITSPFDVKKEKTSLHCLLKLHALNELCPHSNSVKDTSISFTIASGFIHAVACIHGMDISHFVYSFIS